MNKEKVVNRCDHCKKVSHIINKCKCNMSYCLKHLVAEKHNCSYDYKLEKTGEMYKYMENPIEDTRILKI